MAWEERGNNEYYYRKRRIGNRVVSEYVGNGFFAELLAVEDEQEWQRRQDLRRQRREQREAMKEVDDQLDQFGDMVRVLTRATMLAEGYHQHKGQWRRKRNE